MSACTCSDEEYTIVFDDDEEVADDDASDSAYLPNVLSPIRVRLEEDEFGVGEPLADLNHATPKKVGDDSSSDDDNDDAGIVEAVDTLLKMHPLPSTCKRSTRQQHQTTEAEEKEEEGVEKEVVDEWRNATDPKSGRTYFYNRRTRETRWKLPANAILIPRKEKTTKQKKKKKDAQKKEASASSSAPSASDSTGHERSSDNASTTGPCRQAQHDDTAAAHNKRKTENACARAQLNSLYNLTPPPGTTGAVRQLLCSPLPIRRRDESSGLDDDNAFGPADSASGAAIHTEAAAAAPVQGATSTPAPSSAASPVPTHSYSHPQPHSYHQQRQNDDDHSIFCIYCASSCGSIDGMADHLLECEDYMSMLAKHPRAQRRLEDMMLRTWGIKREVPVPTAEDSFDARLISHSHLGDGILDAVASPSIAEHLTPNPAASTATCGSSIHYWNRTPPSAMNVRPITASTVSSANTCTDAVGDQRFTHANSKRQKENESLISYPPSLSSTYASTSINTDPQYLDGGIGRTGTCNHNYYYHENDFGKSNCCDDDSSSPLRECAFCGRAVENLSKHLLRCKRRQRTQERRRQASAMASGGHMPRSATTTIQRVMSGGRSLPGHPKADKRIDHARRLDYC
mmetsp:Transcript_25727/g.74422  ORF Transcript_25727/g.74422 Transcript_25727/m.74422 type:complete len:628 (-) Transcript_25727:112-1995(-)